MANNRVELTPVYVLHSRPFRNTSLIVDLFSQTYGLVSAVARSARGPKSRYQGQLQLFTPIVASWFGNHELKTLTQIELSGMPLQLNQNPLFCGFYLNELLLRLLHKEDPHPALFDSYHHSLCALEKGGAIPVILRTFEKKLLEELGYGLPLLHEAKTGAPIECDQQYEFEPSLGFARHHAIASNDYRIFSGVDLLAIAQEKFESEAVLQAAKRLMRQALAQLLGNKPLHSRDLF